MCVHLWRQYYYSNLLQSFSTDYNKPYYIICVFRSTYQLAFPPFVIHIFCPLTTYSSPFFTARVLTPATSEPAPGSVTQYACWRTNHTVLRVSCDKTQKHVVTIMSVVSVKLDFLEVWRTRVFTYAHQRLLRHSAQVLLLLHLISSENNWYLLCETEES